MAGGTTAECAAVVCCFPCTVFHVILMAVYKVPAGLYRKAVRKKRHRRLLKKGLKIQNDDITGTGHRSSIDGAGERFVMKSMESDEEFIKLENEIRAPETDTTKPILTLTHMGCSKDSQGFSLT
ncbi:hypothetical protein E3N88_02896 [Mikania micrantha]|uniref:Uncharacterized protein n=1 Tax=Mikania micrantha TaxID=192012 RepID=A0A5N6Q7T2_9ASTR|nr:hypothetical protein E3N88_02896 [Mikania micrantha]